MSLPQAESYSRQEPFRHEALFYAGEEDFVRHTSAFIREGIEAGEPVLVAVVAPKIDLISSALGPVADKVLFADMAEVGRNPARIIPLWREFVDGYSTPGRGVRGIGEPIWAARTPEELIESQRHESLLNIAFAGDPAWILCPYDTKALGPSILEEAHRSHPVVSHGGVAVDSSICLQPDDWAAPFDRPLTHVPADARSVQIVPGSLAAVRDIVFREALASGLDASRADDLVIALNEVATNSIRHGGGSGILQVWNEGPSLVCEVRDESHGQISKPLAGRVRPKVGQEGGFGLWLVNQLCDLVQIRTFPSGSVVRLHMTTPTA